MFKQELFGVQNAYAVAGVGGRRFELCLHLALPADTILKMSGDGLEFDTIQKV